MNTHTKLTALLLAGLLAAGCTDGAEEDPELQGDAGTMEEPYGAEEPAGAADTAAQPGGAATLATSTLDDGTTYLTDGAGRALYMLEAEPETGAQCYEGCTELWPPFTASQGMPTAQGGTVQEGLIGTTERADGTTQVTYAGHPLYYYHLDAEQGDIKGQDRHDAWGEWYLVAPSGEHVEEKPEAGTTAEP